MLFKRFLQLFFFIFLCGKIEAQLPEMLSAKTKNYEKELLELRLGHGGKKKRGIGNALLNLYQKRISVLISADCVYALSCSRFSREAINKKGLIKGILLSADRLSRCAYPCTKDVPDFKFNKDGLAEDNP
jgi:putative component of membrane protein insertase Oxa1/YidC/SpoIIIJ protein YidD